MTSITRRDLLKTTAVGAVTLAVPSLSISVASAADEVPAFTLPKLDYAFDALEPHIDAQTMEIHHDRHHKAYVDNLNKALAGNEWAKKSLPEILQNLEKLPEKIRTAVRNNGGGHWNHSFFWTIMAKKGGKPSGGLNDAIVNSFVDLDSFKKMFKEAAMTRFGSGWAWLTVAKGGKLKIVSSPNQDSPVMEGGTPILGIDVWEHAYYLKYQNKRTDYVDAWWNVVNWDLVSDPYEKGAKA